MHESLPRLPGALEVKQRRPFTVVMLVLAVSLVSAAAFTDSSRYFKGVWNVSYVDVVSGTQGRLEATVSDIPNPSFKGSLSISIHNIGDTSTVIKEFVLCPMKDGKLAFGESFANAKRFVVFPKLGDVLGTTGYFKPFHFDASFMLEGIITVTIVNKSDNHMYKFEFTKHGRVFKFTWTEERGAAVIGAFFFISELFLMWNGRKMIKNQREQALKVQEARKNAEEAAEKDPTVGHFEK